MDKTFNDESFMDNNWYYNILLSPLNVYVSSI
jgi:hypothetical protein